MMEDIKRICLEPTDEDKRPGSPRSPAARIGAARLKEAWANYRDESFIKQYLSPHLMRKMRLFVLTDDSKDTHFTISDIHDERGFRDVRAALARSYDQAYADPDIQVADVDLRGDRKLRLQHTMRDGVPLEQKGRDEVLKHVRRLWGYDVSLSGIDRDSERIHYQVSTVASSSD